ncbi:LacI family DNA-binding transcriptional regulator [Sphaerisporangium sp. NPDC088356]|uniref:LacI family DNA-binding transcriptional regulator n=1 Tax=Sphaerisporangium sp. NPDC088356 TaxID=3154871 RepID=UPI0034430CD8
MRKNEVERRLARNLWRPALLVRGDAADGLRGVDVSGNAPARLRDVAEVAGVHVSTASRVLNGELGRVPLSTQRRIIQAAEKLQYRPNQLARGLKLSSTGAVGLLVPSLRNPAFSELIRGAFHRAFERNVVVLLAEDTGQSESQEAYERLVEFGRIDGLLIASGQFDQGLLSRLVERNLAHVFVNRPHPRSGRNVVMDEEAPGRLAAHHLLELGHRRLGHLAGPNKLDTARRRTRGFMTAIKAAGVTTVETTRSEYEEGAAFDAMKKLLAKKNRPTGVFVSNINQAIGGLAALTRAGVRVPEDMSLVCCDDDPLVEFLAVPLTTIRMPLWELGVAGVDALLAQIDGEGPSNVRLALPPILIERASTCSIDESNT